MLAALEGLLRELVEYVHIQKLESHVKYNPRILVTGVSRSLECLLD